MKNRFLLLLTLTTTLTLTNLQYAQNSKWGVGTELVGLEPSDYALKGTAPLLIYASHNSKLNNDFDFIFRPGIMLTTFSPQLDMLFKYSFKNNNYFVAGAKAYLSVYEFAQSPPKLNKNLTYALGVGIMLSPQLALTFTHYGGSFVWMGLDYRL